MRYFYNKEEKKYKDRVEHKNGRTYEISLSSASSGLQALIPLQLMMQYYTSEYFERYAIKSAFDDDEKDKLLRHRLTDKVVIEKLYPGYIESQRGELVREVNQKLREGEGEYVKLLKEYKAVYNQLAVPKRTSFVIEEPEENLYPYSQISLLELMVPCNFSLCRNGKITVPKTERCGACSGTGVDKYSAVETCSKCNGTGKITQ